VRSLVFLVPLLPFLGFAVLALGGGRLTRRQMAYVGAGSVGLAALFALLAAGDLLLSPPADHVYTQTLWTWFSVGGFAPKITLYLDPLSIVMMLVVTVVGFFIHLYATAHMQEDEGYRRFFAAMNLFVGMMLTLVLADNLLLLYLGWEGVGLCSYLLIGHWYQDPANGRAARKAFIVTRIGDTALIAALFLLVTHFGTLQIQQVMTMSVHAWPKGSALAVATALLVLGGAVGKSAQLPLQTWLPDAMAGPTPVSALIHAATMVTAGVYLIARTNLFYLNAPQVRLTVAIVGAATLVYAGCSALVQRDIKRVLAYSTISQIGYMFLALGVGAWSAAIFHLVTHAFFKALLFLSAGVVIEAMGGEHDIFKMGGLRRRLPLVFWSFLIGAAALAALPLITAGYYSKDLILSDTLSSGYGSFWLWLAGAVGACLTSLYIFRVVFVVFFGPAKKEPVRQARPMEALPLYVLGALSVIGGFINLPKGWVAFQPFEDFLHHVLPAAPAGSSTVNWLSVGVAPEIGVVFIALAWRLYRRGPQPLVFSQRAPWSTVAEYWFSGWGFDWVYDRLAVRPLLWFANVSRDDLVEPAVQGIAAANRGAWRLLSRSQDGLVRLYAGAVGLGVIALVAIVVFVR
jgi:NADH-quinone oxidoreductase subunit L